MLDGYGTLWTDFLTWVRKTALTAVGNMIMSFRTAVAGKLDYVYKRWIVILFCDRTFFNAVSHRLMLLDRSLGADR